MAASKSRSTWRYITQQLAHQMMWKKRNKCQTKKTIAIMNADPGISEGIMTAELFPYKVALFKGGNGIIH